MNNEFAEQLAAKTGMELKKIHELLMMIDDIQVSEKVGDIQLMQLHNRIQECIKH